MQNENPVAAAAAAYESVTFQVTNVGAKEKAGKIQAGYVEFKSPNAKGTSKITLIGSETLIKEYRLGEFYRMELTQVPAPEQP